MNQENLEDLSGVLIEGNLQRVKQEFIKKMTRFLDDLVNFFSDINFY